MYGSKECLGTRCSQTVWVGGGGEGLVCMQGEWACHISNFFHSIQSQLSTDPNLASRSFVCIIHGFGQTTHGLFSDQ